MRFAFALLAALCLLTAFLTSSPLLLGLSLIGCALFSLIAVFAFAQARIDASQQRQIYIPSPEERDLMRKALAKRQVATETDKRPDDAEE